MKKPRSEERGFYGWGIGIRIIDSQCEWEIRIVLLAKNNSPNCFLNAKTLTGSNPTTHQNKKIKPPQKRWFHFHGWGIGIRTPTNRVRVCRATVTLFPNEQKQLYINDSQLSSIF